MSLVKSFSIKDRKSSSKKRRGKRKKIFLAILGVLLIFLGLGYFFVFLPAQRIYKQALILRQKAGELKANLRQNDITLAKNSLQEFKKDYARFAQAAEGIYWMKYIPVLGVYVQDFENGVLAGEEFIRAGELVIKAIEPHADLLGFRKGEASFVEKPVEERIKTAVFTLEKIKDDIEEISKVLDRANGYIQKIDPQRYPEKIGDFPIRPRLQAARDQVLGFTELFVSAKPLLKNLPEILGSDREKTYLILFQNDTELRATGGFWTAYAIFKIDKGNMRLETSEDIYELDASISKRPPTPEKILKYHKGVNKFFIRDSNLSPDFVESIKLFNKLYENSSKKVEYDGIIAIDTKVLVDLLEIFGDTEVSGVVFSSRIDKRCDCAQAIYRLLEIIGKPTPYIREDRKGILGRLTYALFRKAIGFSPSKYWGRLVQSMLVNLEQKHILLYFTDPDLQKAAETLNFAGRIRDYDGDYLHINDVNFAGAKSNLFVRHSIKSETFFENGKVRRKLTITYRNPFPHSDCNLERGGLCLNATLRNWIRVYVPKGSKLLSFRGSKMKVLTYQDLGKTVFEGFLTVPTQGKAVVIVEYELPAGLVDKDNYRLLIQKQPGTKGHKLSIYIDKEKLQDTELLKDLEIKPE